MKGGPLPPVHKLTTTNRNSPPRAGGAQGSCDCRREAPGGSGTGPLVPAQKAPVHRSRLWAPVPDRSTRGGKVRKGGHRPPFTRRKRPIGTRHRAPEARKEVSIAGAKRRAVRERGPSFQLRRHQSTDPVYGPRFRTARHEGGRCERGAIAPLSQEGNDQSELATARRRRARKFRFPSQERPGVGFPDPNPSCSGVSVRLAPHFGSPSYGAARSRVPRPQPLLLRGLRATLAALRKRGAERRAFRGQRAIRRNGYTRFRGPPGRGAGLKTGVPGPARHLLLAALRRARKKQRQRTPSAPDAPIPELIPRRLSGRNPSGSRQPSPPSAHNHSKKVGHFRSPLTHSRCRCPERAKTMAANSVRCPPDRGESVKGGLPPPVHKNATTNRNSPKCASGARGSCDSRARSGWESGPPTPTPPAPGSPCGSRRTPETRREAPGGSGGGRSCNQAPPRTPNGTDAPLPDRSTRRGRSSNQAPPRTLKQNRRPPSGPLDGS